MKLIRAIAPGAVVAGLLLSGGCGKAAEKLTESAIENQTGADIDISGGNVRVTTPEGYSYELDEDGNMVILGPDGEKITSDADGNMTSVGPDGESTQSAGENATLPEGWPDFLALPEGAKLSMSRVMTQEGTTSAQISAEVDADVVPIYESFRKAMVSAGFEFESETLSESGGSTFGNLTGTKGEQTLMIAVSSNDDGSPGYLSINIEGY